jgi:thiamine pyrophosphate-dependent acetolactate synthase large subunit-like protein
MADALSRLSSGEKIGVFAMQHGPGAENAFGGIAQAFGDSVPLLVLPQGYARRMAHVQPNFNSVLNMRGVTKSAEPITSAAEIPSVFRRAFTRLRSGRGGPVLVEIPSDVFAEEVPEPLDYRPAARLRTGPDPDAVRAAAKRLIEASRPVIYAGQGVHYAKAWAEFCDWPSCSPRRSPPASRERARFQRTIRWRWSRAGSRSPQPCTIFCATPI